MFALSEFDIRYQPAKAVKGQALADLIAERINTDIAALSVRAWAMFFDGSVCDGGCGIGILIVSPRGATYSFSIRLPTPCTNNVAEYEAICKGMELLLEAGAEAVELFGDSKLVISQLTEEYKCESESLFPLWMHYRELMAQFKYINFNWIPRSQNTEANDLAQMASGYKDVADGADIQNDLTTEEYAALMSDSIEDVTELRLWSLEKIKENKAKVARAYNKKVRPKEFDVGITLQDSINPKSQSEDIVEEHPQQLAPSVGTLLAQDQSSADPIMSSTSSSAPPSPTLGGPVRFGSYEFTPHSDSSRSNFSDLQGNMEMTIGSVHYNVNAEGILQLLESPTSRSTSPSASSSLDLCAGLTESMSSPAPSTPRSASSMSVGSDEPTSSELTSYYCSNCDARHGLGSSDTPFICNARYSSGEDSVGSIARRATRRTAHHQVYVANNTGNTRHGGDGDRTPRSSRRASFENSASNRDSDYTITDEEWAAARTAVLNNTPLPAGTSVGTLNAYRSILEKNREHLSREQATLERRLSAAERSSERRRASQGSASRSALGAGKHRSRLSRLSEDDAREITSNLTKSFMTTDTAGMPRPKNIAGATANLAAYLINQRPEGSMAQAHRGALESLAILGNNLVPQKEKTTAQASGSKHRARDARDEITQSRLIKQDDDAPPGRMTTVTPQTRIKSTMVN
ncbi:hypothetical protein QYE76_012061 [Lolium multiflorum]|uniref:RNase H type-1 domain-containing protein n=1 Tax=Lolium multiflorum TaxID=4521 RepID=A0AAD8U0C1_LOLMU|nr:hypothetical protein QYE76_012061 [Lolium multiflorum]